MHRRAWSSSQGCFWRPPAHTGRLRFRLRHSQRDSVTVNIVSHVGSLVIFAKAAGHSYRMGIVEVGTPRQFMLRFGWLWGRSVEFRVRRISGVHSGYLNLNPGMSSTGK